MRSSRSAITARGKPVEPRHVAVLRADGQEAGSIEAELDEVQAQLCADLLWRWRGEGIAGGLLSKRVSR